GGCDPTKRAALAGVDGALDRLRRLGLDLPGAAPVSKVATYAYVNPVVAVALGGLLRDEQLTAPTVVGGAVTVLAVAVVVREEGRRRRAGALQVPAAAPFASNDMRDDGPDTAERADPEVPARSAVSGETATASSAAPPRTAVPCGPRP
ncbi:MAG: hypothetical protein KY451_14475, partial [Actinobacteria bacterium]|nr:hypothetical protein [Actinomycetota bacterium]